MKQVLKNIEERVIWQKRFLKVLEYAAMVLSMLAFDWVFIELYLIAYR